MENPPINGWFRGTPHNKGHLCGNQPIGILSVALESSFTAAVDETVMIVAGVYWKNMKNVHWFYQFYLLVSEISHKTYSGPQEKRTTLPGCQPGVISMI